MKNFVVMFLVFSFLSFANIALAHDVDKTQKRVHHLNLDNPEFFKLWFSYWHERRLLVTDMVDYARCVGEIKALYRVGGWAEFDGEETAITGYWNVIPAVPLEENPKSFKNAKKHIQAALDTRAQFQYHTENCYAYRDYLQWYLGITR
jgi:hypothetical protein